MYSYDVILSQLEWKEKEDQLNGVLTDYQKKIEEMTRQLNDYNAKVTKCEDQKATAVVSMQKLESEKSECLSLQASINKEKVGRLESGCQQSVNFTWNVQNDTNVHKCLETYLLYFLEILLQQDLISRHYSMRRRSKGNVCNLGLYMYTM